MGSRCYNCGNRLTEDEAICPGCGRKQAVDEALVNAAKQNDQQAITEIYMLSYRNVFSTVRSMVKDESTAEDLVQDTFIKVFESLDSLNYEEGRFQAWVRRIAHNTTVNYVRKKKEVLFSEMEGDDSDSDAGIEFEDERTEHLPEVVMDQNETTRLIREMLDTLSEEQRIAVGMYYYEQCSVNEIAETLGVSVNTVKSRLNYARKKIETQVRALEKQGTKLYGLSPVPFLMLLFRNMGTQVSTPDAATAEKAVGAILTAKTALEAAGQGQIAATVAQEASAVSQAAAAQSGETAASTAAAQGGTSAGQAATGQAASSAGQTATGQAAASAGKATATAGKTTAAVGKGIAIKVTAGVLAVGLAGGAIFYAANRKPEEAVDMETEIVLAIETEEPSEIIEAETETETETVKVTEETETEESYYTFTSLDWELFVKEDSDVMDLPEWNGESIGTLSVGDIIEVTGQCNETEWYQINYNGETGYVWNYNVLDYSIPSLCAHSNWIEFYNDENGYSTSLTSDSDGRMHLYQEEPSSIYWYMCEECSMTCTDLECNHELTMGYTYDSIYEGTCGELKYTIYENTFYYICEKCGAYWVY